MSRRISWNQPSSFYNAGASRLHGSMLDRPIGVSRQRTVRGGSDPTG